jgi:hypothetical protein
VSRAGLIAALLTAAVVGAFLWARVRVALERCRRVIFEWKKGRRGQRTLRKMLRRYVGQAASSIALVLLVVALAIVVIVRG